MKKHIPCLMLATCFTSQLSEAAYVTPQMGGGSPGQVTVAMKHADIYLFGQQLLVNLDESIQTPELRELSEPDEFDHNATWSVLSDKAYNFQFGWNPGGFISLPTNTAIWIEQIDSTNGLEVFDRTPSTLGYEPIFGTEGSSTKWRWSGSMTHNVYAVHNPSEDEYYAEYQVYVGDYETGDVVIGYQSAMVRFDFIYDLPLPGDYDGDGNVSTADYQEWISQFGQTGHALSADGNQDGTVDSADFTIWRDNFNSMLASIATTVPEPTSAALLTVGFVLTRVLTFRRQAGNIL